jgi:prevent-host-death family protein
MSKEVTVAEVKKHLSSWVRDAEYGETVVITRRGKPVAALVSTADLEQLKRLRAAGPDAGLVGLAGGWDSSDELVHHTLLHTRTRGRDLPDLE